MMLRQRHDRTGSRGLAAGKGVQGEDLCGCGCVTSTMLKPQACNEVLSLDSRRLSPAQVLMDVERKQLQLGGMGGGGGT